jgi:amidase
MTDLAFCDATAQAELVRTGQASPTELVDAAIERIERINPQVNAVIHDRYERARDEAAGTLPDGPFRGVPTLFKDLLCAMEGEPYHFGTGFLKRHGFRAPHTDHLARRFLGAGFVCLGRTNAPELGLLPVTEPSAYGPTHTPWDPTRTAGGSSGGSAAAVAAGLVPVAHGNDGGGSIRIPASCCGLVGLKPSRGRSSLGPMSGQLTDLLVVEMMLTRSVRDAAGCLEAIREPFPGDPVIAPPPARPYPQEVGAEVGRLRVGLLTHNPLGTGTVHPDCVDAAQGAARLLEELGHHVDADAWPKPLENPGLAGVFSAIWTAGAAVSLDAFAAAVGEPITHRDVEPLTWALAEAGRQVSAVQLLQAVGDAQRFSRAVAEWWEDFDLLVTPTLAAPPLPLGALDPPPDNPMLGFARAAEFVPFTPPFNVTGQPAISLPLHHNDQGLPIGVQLVAAYGREDLLLRVAAQLEQARPWAGRIPPVHA